MPHFLIAGHGYLGQELARKAQTAGWTGSALSKSGEGSSIACDFTSQEEVRALSQRIAPPSAIVFSASSGRGGPDAYRAVFLEGTRNLLDVFPQAHPLFVSSTSVYHQTDGSLVTERSPTTPDRETSQILLEAEEIVLNANGTVARLAGIYGPGRSVVLKRFFDNKAIIEEDGRRYLNQIHRDDGASALLHLASHPEISRGETYNVSDSSPIHQAELYHALARLFDHSVPPTGPRPENSKRAWTHKKVSNEKIRATNWEPEYPSFIEAATSIADTL